MEENLEVTKEVEMSDGNKMTLNYFLLTSIKEEEKTEIYGIKISKILNEWLEEEQEEKILDSKETVLDFLHILAKYTVTPITMIETLDDLMTAYLEKK